MYVRMRNLVELNTNFKGKEGQFLFFGILFCIILKYFLHIFYHLNYSALPENYMLRNSQNAQLNTTSED